MVRCVYYLWKKLAINSKTKMGQIFSKKTVCLNCQKRGANYGLPEENSRRCYDCRRPDDLNIPFCDSCIHTGGNTIAAWQTPWSNTFHCDEHKGEYDWRVKQKSINPVREIRLATND